MVHNSYTLSFQLDMCVTQLYIQIVRRRKNQLFQQLAVKNDFFHQFFPLTHAHTFPVWKFWYAVGTFYVSCLPQAFLKDLSPSMYTEAPSTGLGPKDAGRPLG